MWNKFHKRWIYALVLLFAGCAGCAALGGKSGEAGLVDEIAENCRQGMGTAAVHKEDDELNVSVKCK
jgi:hypothetical protein